MKLGRKFASFDLLGVVAVVILFLPGVRLLLLQLLRPKTYLRVLEDPANAANFLGNLVSGVLTVFAAGIAILVFRLQERADKSAEIVEWIRAKRDSFHADRSFRAMRECVAGQRQHLRAQVASEFATANVFAWKFYPSLQPLLAEDRAPLEWPFLCDFSDYLYYFEEILARGEDSANHLGGFINPYVLDDNFGWYIRSLYDCCHAGDGEGASAVDARRFFLHYLSVFRYRRLTEVGICLLQTDAEAAAPDPLVNLLLAPLKEHRPSLYRRPSDVPAFRRKWARLLGIGPESHR